MVAFSFGFAPLNMQRAEAENSYNYGVYLPVIDLYNVVAPKRAVLLSCCLRSEFTSWRLSLDSSPLSWLQVSSLAPSSVQFSALPRPFSRQVSSLFSLLLVSW